MTRRVKLIEDLREYFISKGKVLTYNEYIAQDDAPFRAQIIKRTVGTWARLVNMIGELPVAAPAPEKPKAPTKVEKPTATKEK